MAITKTVALVHDKAYAGMVADLQLANRVSRFNATSAVIPFGTAVQADTDAGSMKPIASGGTAIGVLVRELVDVTNPGSEQGVNVGKTGTVLTDGVIWVKAYEAVTVGENVFAGVGAAVKGYFCAAEGSDGTEAVQITGAKYLDAASAKGDLVRIKITIGG